MITFLYFYGYEFFFKLIPELVTKQIPELVTKQIPLYLTNNVWFIHPNSQPMYELKTLKTLVQYIVRVDVYALITPAVLLFQFVYKNLLLLPVIFTIVGLRVTAFNWHHTRVYESPEGHYCNYWDFDQVIWREVTNICALLFSVWVICFLYEYAGWFNWKKDYYGYYKIVVLLAFILFWLNALSHQIMWRMYISSLHPDDSTIPRSWGYAAYWFWRWLTSKTWEQLGKLALKAIFLPPIFHELIGLPVLF